MKYLEKYDLSSVEQNAIIASSQLFYKMIEDYNDDPFGLVNHLEQLQKRAIFALDNHEDIDSMVLFLSIWLHDIGHYPVDDIDHAVKGELIAQRFLEEKGLEPHIINKVAHCVRSHRNRDIPPETLEAKMMACIDSASHLTDPIMYMSIVKSGRFEYLDGKIDRDYRDVQHFPKVLDKVTPFYIACKQLIEEHKKFIF